MLSQAHSATLLLSLNKEVLEHGEGVGDQAFLFVSS
jgi:hypothetical protein